MIDEILKQNLPIAWENFKDMALTIWDANSTLLTGFTIFFLFGSYLLWKVKKHHRHY